MTEHPLIAPGDEGSPALDIYRQLRALIVSGQLAANERLPTVRQAATDLGVAPGTVAKAYKLLESDGLVISRTAAGTRVAASAGLLPQAVLTHVRELAEEASLSGAELNDVISVLRLVWHEPPDTARHSG